MRTAIELIKNRSDIGAGTRGSDLGIDAMEIAAINKGSRFFKQYPSVDIPTRNDIVYENDLNPHAKHIKQVYRQCVEVAYAVKESLRKNHYPLVLSGDHSSAAGTISGIKWAFPQQTLGVLWIDAHADIHSPYTTPSGNMHGMPLAAVLNEDNLSSKINEVDEETIAYWRKLQNIGVEGPKILPEHLIYFGVRDTELQEEELLARLGIKNYQVEEVRSRGVARCVEEALQRLSDCDLLYISFDVDSMDSELISDGTGTPVPRGFVPSEVALLLKGLIHSEKSTCMEVVEVNPLLDRKGNKMAEVAFEIVEQAAHCIQEVFPPATSPSC